MRLALFTDTVAICQTLNIKGYYKWFLLQKFQWTFNVPFF